MLHHGLRAAAGNSGLSFTYQSGLLTNVNSTNITVPAGASVGDLAILVDSPLSISAITLVIPSGWTSVYNFSGTATNVVRVSFSYKVLTSGDLGASISGMSGSAASRKSIMIFRPSKTITTMSGGGGVGEITNNAPTLKTIASSSQSPPAIAIGIMYASSPPVINSTSMTSVATDTTAKVLFYTIMNTVTSDQTMDMADSGTNNIVAGCYFKAT